MAKTVSVKVQPTVRIFLPLMEENLFRVKGDLDWLVAKYDYRNASKPWGTAKDALPRAMQKLQGIYPTDEPYRDK